MKFCTFASGSSGNCAFLTHGETHVLIDAGISMRRIKNSLGVLGRTIPELDGVFITHVHSDHIKALKMLLKYYDITIYATERTAQGILWQLPEAEGSIQCIAPGEIFTLGEMEILPFTTPHDAPGSVGYRFQAGDKSFGVVTDLGFPSADVFNAVRGVDAIMLEANHDVDMLMNGPYPYHLRQRILSKSGHLSNYDCGRLAAALAESGTRQIILAHLSTENNTPELAKSEVSLALEGLDVSLAVAPRSEMGEVYII